MSTYGAMVARISDDINRVDLSNQIKEAIKTAIDYYEDKRFWFNDERAYTITVPGQEFYAMPSDFIDTESVKISVNNHEYMLSPRTYQFIENIQNNPDYNGAPTDYALFQEQIRLYPIPDASYSLTLSYTKELTDLSATADTNAWMTYGEELIRNGAEKRIYRNVLRQYDHAKQCSAQESMAYFELKKRNDKYMSTGRIRRQVL